MAMTPTTIRRLSALLAVALAIGGTIFLVDRLNKRKANRQLVIWKNEGLAAKDRGDWPKAVDSLGKYLEKFPKDHAALLAFITARPHVIDPNRHVERDQTIAAMQRFLELDPSRKDIRQALIDSYIILGHDTEAKTEAEKLVEQTAGKDAAALRSLAMVNAHLKIWPASLDAWEKLLKLNPTDLNSQMRRLATMKESGAAKIIYLKLADDLLRDPNNLLPGGTPDPRFEVLKAWALELAELPGGSSMKEQGGQADPRPIGQLLKDAARRLPPDQDLPKILIEELNRHGLYDDAVNVLRRVADDPKATERAQAEAVLVARLWELRAWEELINRTDKIPLDATSEMEVRELGMRGFALWGMHRGDEAKIIALKLGAHHDNYPAVAWALILNKEIDPSSQDPLTIQAALKRVPSLDTYLSHYLAESYSRIGESEMAARMWAMSATQTPTWSLPLECLANVLMERGRTDAAMVYARLAALRSLDAGGNVVGSAALTLIRVETADLENPTRHTGGATLAEVGLLAEVEAVQDRNPGEPFTLPIQVALLAKLAKVEKGAKADAYHKSAVKIMKGVLAPDARPTEDVLLRLAVVSRGYGMEFESQCLDRCERLYGITPNLAMVRAGAMIASGDRAGAVAFIKSAAKRQSPADKLAWDLSLARTLEIARDPEARVAWQTIAGSFPDSLAAQESVLNAISAQSDRELIRLTIERLKKLTGDDGLLWRIARARWLIDPAYPPHADVEEAAKLLNEVLKFSPDYADAYFLLSRCDELLDDLDGAIDHMRLAADKTPTSTATAVHLVRLLQSKGEFTKASELLDQLVARHVQEPGQRRQIAVLQAQRGDTQGALATMLNSANPEQEAPDLLTASLYDQQGQYEKARAICEKLLKAPDPSIVQFAAGLYAAHGEKAQEAKTLAMLDLEAMKLPPGQKESILAQHKARYGTPEEAERWFKAATAAGPKESAIWRQLIAWYLQAGKTAEALTTAEQALKTIPDDKVLQTVVQSGSTLKKAGERPELNALCAAIVDTSLRRGAVTEVLDIILRAKAGETFDVVKDAATRYPVLLPLQLYVVEVGRREGHPEAAINAAKHVANFFPARSEGPRIAANLLMEMGQWTEAIGMARQWRERSIRDTFKADLLIAVARLQLKQYSEAVKTLEPYIADADAHPDSDINSEALIFYSAGLVREGQSEKAYSHVKPLLAKDVKSRYRWEDAALRYFEELDVKQALERVAAITDAASAAEQVQLAESWTILADHGKTAYLDQARHCLEPFLKDPAVPAAVLSSMGNIEEKQGNSDAAEKYYRQALQRDPKFYTAMNNLAMCLIRKNDAPEAFKEAVTLAQAAVNANLTNPALPAIYDTLARAQAKAKDADGALASMRMVVKLDPNNIDRRLSLITMLLDFNRADEARGAISSLESAIGTQLNEEGRKHLQALRRRLEGSSTPAASSR